MKLVQIHFFMEKDCCIYFAVILETLNISTMFFWYVTLNISIMYNNYNVW